MSSINKAKIDVLIPAYNAETTIESALASIQTQAIQDIRIIVVNDGSTDRTGEILEKLKSKDPRIEVITTVNGGIVDALNHGLQACRADYIARHDADDIAFPNRLEVQLRYLQSNLDCIAVGSNVSHIDENGRRLGTRSLLGGDVKPDADWVPSREPYLIHPFLMVRTAAVQQVGGYRYVFHSEDTDLYWRLLSLGRLHNLEEILGEYRIHSGSISSASALNGRIAAVSAQLAALSFRRRRSGQPDITFSKDALAIYKNKETFREICDAASTQLDASERAYLELSSAVKLLSLLELRPYQPTVEDCQFIDRTIRQQQALLTQKNKGLTKYLRGVIVLKLLRAGKFAEIQSLTFSLECILRVFLSSLRRKLATKTA